MTRNNTNVVINTSQKISKRCRLKTLAPSRLARMERVGAIKRWTNNVRNAN